MASAPGDGHGDGSICAGGSGRDGGIAYGAGVGSNAVATGASTRSVVVTANTKGSPTHTNANAAADVMRAMRTALGAGARPSTSSDEASRTCSYFCEVRLRMVDHV